MSSRFPEPLNPHTNSALIPSTGETKNYDRHLTAKLEKKKITTWFLHLFIQNFLREWESISEKDLALSSPYNGQKNPDNAYPRLSRLSASAQGHFTTNCQSSLKFFHRVSPGVVFQLNYLTKVSFSLTVRFTWKWLFVQFINDCLFNLSNKIGTKGHQNILGLHLYLPPSRLQNKVNALKLSSVKCLCFAQLIRFFILKEASAKFSSHHSWTHEIHDDSRPGEKSLSIQKCGLPLGVRFTAGAKQSWQVKLPLIQNSHSHWHLIWSQEKP